MARGDNLRGKGFETNKHNINRKGRPRRTVSTLLEEIRKAGGQELKPVDIKSLYLSLLDRTQEELLGYANNKELSMVVRIIAKSMLDKKGFDIIERMLDRTMGRPTQLMGEDKDNQFTSYASIMKHLMTKKDQENT